MSFIALGLLRCPLQGQTACLVGEPVLVAVLDRVGGRHPEERPRRRLQQ